MSIPDNTPILVGAGQASERPGEPGYRALSPTDLTAEAARAALRDALPGDANAVATLAAKLDALYAVRTMADSLPAPLRPQAAPFGGPDKVPAALARRIGAAPRLAVYSPACGDEPQRLVGEACERLALGDYAWVLLCGGEAISTTRAAKARQEPLDWNEHDDAPVEDRRGNIGVLRTKYMTDHQLLMPPTIYPLFEQARRSRLGLSRAGYARAMGALMAPFSGVAAANPHAASRRRWSAEAIADVGPDNRMISDPHPISVVARDQVNQAAALLLTTVGQARAAGIPEANWVYLHGYSALDERMVLDRQDLGASPAMQAAYGLALAAAGATVADVRHIDIYSCFPIAVFAAIDALGLQSDDPRGLTLTGGLPYFGGPGNNYSMHALCALMARLRAQPGTLGLVGANGGLLSTHAVGVYSTTPRAFQMCDSAAAQRAINALPAPPLVPYPDGWSTLESYTVLHDKSGPQTVVVVGRCARTGGRFLANSAAGDVATLAAFTDPAGADPLGLRITVRHHQGRNLFALGQAALDTLAPPPRLTLQASYAHVIVERRGAVLEVTINRPEANNALTPEANDELEQIFNSYDADPSLWVAIITGSGSKAFCTGNDLQVAASGRRLWLPRTGFGGLTSRPDRVKPVIAAVNGDAMGGGFEIALASDLIVADETAQFALSQVRVGLIASAGGLQRLTRQIPYKQAMEMILTGRRVPAAEASDLGFVNRVVAAGTALAGARALADTLLDCSPTAIRLSKTLLHAQARIASETEAVQPAYTAVDRLLASEDRIEGMAAFVQQRKPVWTNR